jgi:RimJ/RimL family protein N-acetyltransferase
VRLEPLDLAGRDAALRGDLGAIGGLTAAPGWPHDDTRPGLSFLDSGGWAFLIIDDDGRVAGECGTKLPPTEDGMVEIGYGLAAPSRGRGLGTAAIEALVSWLAQRGDVSRIEAEVHVGNAASQRLLERIGFAADEGLSGPYRRYRIDPVGHLAEPLA